MRYIAITQVLLPTMMGFVARRKGIRRAFLLPAAVGVIMAVLILMNRIASSWVHDT